MGWNLYYALIISGIVRELIRFVFLLILIPKSNFSGSNKVFVAVITFSIGYFIIDYLLADERLNFSIREINNHGDISSFIAGIVASYQFKRAWAGKRSSTRRKRGLKYRKALGKIVLTNL